MADQNNPWDITPTADNAAQSAGAQGTPTTVPTDGGGTDWLTSTPAPSAEYFSILGPSHKALIPLDSWITEGIGWVITHFHPVFQGMRIPTNYIPDDFQRLLLGVPVPVAIIVFALIAWQISEVGMGVMTLVSLIAIGAIGAWSQAMVVLALVLTALLFCIAIGLPLGTRLTRSPRAAKVIRPLFDATQTTPMFVYLVPIVMLFGIGNAPSVVVTIIFVLPPVTRLTILGINQVPADLIEALRSFGTSPRQILFRIQLPLAMPTIMAGASQALILTLPMVVTVSMITVSGLGQMVLRGIGRLDVGLATVGDVGIVIPAIILGRLTQAVGRDPRSRGNRRWCTTGLVGLLARPSVKQLCTCPVTPGIITLPKRGITTRHSIFFVTTFTTLISTRTFAANLPGKGITANPIQSTITEETFQTLLVSRALEKSGYIVSGPNEINYNVGYTSLTSGDATFTAMDWTPLHDSVHEATDGDKKFYRGGVFVNDATQGYLIDKETTDQYKITNIAQLRDPKIAKPFDANGDRRTDLIGCNPDWGCKGAINHRLAMYELTNTMMHNQENYAAMMADTISRYKGDKPVFYYAWTPYWVSNELRPGEDIVWSQVPFSALPSDKNADTKLPSNANYGFPISTMHIVANKAQAEKNPATAKLFAIMQLPVTGINAQNAIMHDGKASGDGTQEHVDGWIKVHQQQFDGWVNEALAAQK